jgi:hypothetical protein
LPGGQLTSDLEAKMTIRETDQEAVRIPQRSGLPPCLYVPVAARDEAAIERYVGRVIQVLAGGPPPGAFLVEAHEPPQRDARLPIWQVPGAGILHAPRQVWVHVDFRGYRAAYLKVVGGQVLGDRVLDHVLNRRVARLKGFHYLRIVPISRAANSSSAMSEGWGVEHHGTAYMRQRNAESRAAVQYADLADLVKMLDWKTGVGIMDAVNDAQRLVAVPK